MCGSPGETDVASDPVVHQDLQRAKLLMQEAGYDGRPVVLLNNTDNAVSHAMALVTQQLMTWIGLKVDLQPMDWGLWHEAVRRLSRGRRQRPQRLRPWAQHSPRSSALPELTVDEHAD
jgi:ABC-type transport system substrate-binding protein